MAPDNDGNHVAVMTERRGTDEMIEFYGKHFIPKMPADTTRRLLARTVGKDRPIDELVFLFTHDIEMDWMLLGIQPTHRKVEIPMSICSAPAMRSSKPCDAVKQTRSRSSEARTTPKSCGNRSGKRSGGLKGKQAKRKPRLSYDTCSYARAISRAENTDARQVQKTLTHPIIPASKKGSKPTPLGKSSKQSAIHCDTFTVNSTLTDRRHCGTPQTPVAPNVCSRSNVRVVQCLAVRHHNFFMKDRQAPPLMNPKSDEISGLRCPHYLAKVTPVDRDGR